MTGLCNAQAPPARHTKVAWLLLRGGIRPRGRCRIDRRSQFTGAVLKLIVFDCDGTLVDSQHMICGAMQRAYDAHDIVCPPRETVLSIVGLSLRQAFETLGRGQRDFPVDGMIERYKEAFFELRHSPEHQEPLYPGAREAILTARRARGLRARHRDRQIAARRARDPDASRSAVAFRNHHDRGRRAVEARSRHAGECDARDRRCAARHDDDRRYQLRHGDGARRGRACDRRELGLSCAGHAACQRGGARDRKLHGTRMPRSRLCCSRASLPD